MSVTKDLEVLPNSDLADRANWRFFGNNRYAALRARLLIVQSSGQQSRFGPVIKAYNVAPEDTIELRRRREQVISRTTTISEAIRFTTTSRVCDQLAAKVSAELSAKVAGFSGKLSSEILSKSEYEITTTAENVLNTTTSHVIQETQEEEHVITLKGGNSKRVAALRRRYWPRRWDVYLQSYEYLELSYHRTWFWRDVRDTIKKTDSGVLGWPLVSVLFHEPQSRVDVTYGPITDELANPDSIDIRMLAEPMPMSISPGEEHLEDLANLAFPVTEEEKSKAAWWSKRRGTAKKASVKKSAAKKFVRKPTKRATLKKSAAKKTAPKKAARKPTKRAALRITMKGRVQRHGI